MSSAVTCIHTGHICHGSSLYFNMPCKECQWLLSVSSYFRLDGVTRFQCQQFWFNASLPTAQAYDYVELFAGRGWVCDSMAMSGKATARFDILLGEPEPAKQNNMDLTTDSGFLYLSFCIWSVPVSGTCLTWGLEILVPRQDALCFRMVYTSYCIG